ALSRDPLFRATHGWLRCGAHNSMGRRSWGAWPPPTAARARKTALNKRLKLGGHNGQRSGCWTAPAATSTFVWRRHLQPHFAPGLRIRQEGSLSRLQRRDIDRHGLTLSLPRIVEVAAEGAFAFNRSERGTDEHRYCSHAARRKAPRIQRSAHGSRGSRELARAGR